jgi:hypothetical protein
VGATQLKGKPKRSSNARRWTDVDASSSGLVPGSVTPRTAAFDP